MGNADVPGKQSQNTVTIGGAGEVIIGTPDEYKAHYGGEVYGACRGDATLPVGSFGTSIWTQVYVKNGANIQGNVFGGGDAGEVLKDSEVIIGEAAVSSNAGGGGSGGENQGGESQGGESGGGESGGETPSGGGETPSGGESPGGSGNP